MNSIPRLAVQAALLAALIATARSGLQVSQAAAAPAAHCDAAPLATMAEAEQCLVVRPTDIELMLDLGMMYEAAGRPDRAEALYRSALSVDATDTDVRLRLARIEQGRGGTK